MHRNSTHRSLVLALVSIGGALALTGCTEDSGTVDGGALIASGTSALTRIEPSSARTRSWSARGMRGFPDLSGLTIDPVSGTRYMVATDTDELVVIDRDTGAGVVVAPLSRRGITDLYFDPSTRDLFAWAPDAPGATSGDFVSIDAGTGDATVRASGVPEFPPLAYDVDSDTWWGITNAGLGGAFDDLVEFDRVTGTIGPGLGDIASFGGTINSCTYDPIQGVLVANSGSNVLRVDISNPAAPFAFDEVLFNPIPTTQLRSLAFDPVLGLPIGVDLVRDELVSFDLDSPAVERLGPHGFGGVRRIAHDPTTDMVYGVDTARAELVAIDPDTGLASVVGPIAPLSGVSGLTFDTLAGRLLATDPSGTQIHELDRATGQPTFFANTGLTAAGIAYDPNGDRLFVLADTGQFNQIDTVTGAITVIDSIGKGRIVAWRTLAYDPATDEVLGVRTDDGAIRRLSTADASAGDSVAVIGASAHGLTHDATRERFLATDLDFGQLVEVDPATGAVRPIGEVGADLVALAHDRSTGLVYGFDRSRRSLVTSRATTGELIDSVLMDTAASGLRGLAFDPGASVLYASVGDQIHRVERDTGLLELIVDTNGSAFSALAYDTREGRLVAAVQPLIGQTSFRLIDPVTGAVTTPGLVYSEPLVGLAQDSITNILFGFDSISGVLVQIDLAAGTIVERGTPVGTPTSLGGWLR